LTQKPELLWQLEALAVYHPRFDDTETGSAVLPIPHTASQRTRTFHSSPCACLLFGTGALKVLPHALLPAARCLQVLRLHGSFVITCRRTCQFRSWDVATARERRSSDCFFL